MNREPLHSASDADIRELADRAGRALLTRGWRVVTAESCTAGWVAKALTDIPGSSQWLECGYVTYSNAAKARDILVPQEVLNDHGAVSEETVRAMAWGALQVSGADLAVAISGIAGPDGGAPGKPVGTVWFSVAHRVDSQPQELPPVGDDPIVTSSQVRLFAGDRDQVRRQSVEQALQLVLDALGDASVPGAQVR
jgi:nicotinamide-nucleotide amidase